MIHGPSGIRSAARTGLALVVALALASTARAQSSPDSSLAAVDTMMAVAPVSATDFTAKDVPNDAGKVLEFDWKLSADETGNVGRVTQYRILEGKSADGQFEAIDSVAAGTASKSIESFHAGKKTWLRLETVGPGGSAMTPVVEATPVAQWFNTTRKAVVVAVVLFFLFVLYFISSAQSGKQLFVRRIPGIDAIEEAIGRATEMGRSVLYVPGINDIDDIQTMASLTILESVAKMTAKYETPIVVPTNYPVVFTLAQEMVKNGFVSAGRADSYDPNAVRYVTTEQFAYVAAVSGIMLRDKPAANIYLGSFFAESLLLAETGFSTKAIQVAGTAQVAQLPFFVVACDYTLIGEEMYAASAYLSREPRLLGSLKGSDLMKAVLIAAILVGCVLETLQVHGLKNFMSGL